MPVVGFLGAPSSAPYARYVAAVHQGLKEVGYIEGQNVRFEYRWAEGHYDRLPVLATELIDRHHAAVIVPIGGAPATVAAKAVTSIVPIVFNMTADPVELTGRERHRHRDDGRRTRSEATGAAARACAGLDVDRHACKPKQ